MALPADIQTYNNAYAAAVAELSLLGEEDDFSALDYKRLQPNEEWNRRQWLIHLIAGVRATEAVGLINPPAE